MYNTLSIKVEALPGFHINETVCDMLELAKKFDVMVETTFNGCNLYVAKNSSYQRVLDSYTNYLKHVAKPSLDSLS